MQKKLYNYIYESSAFSWLIDLLKNIRFKRYDDLSLYRVLEVFIEKVSKDEILDRANGVAFSFALSIFPAVIFLFTLTPYIHEVIPQVSRESILEFMGGLMPSTMYTPIHDTIEDVVSNRRQGLLTFGAIFALFLATNGMTALMKAFNACYKTVERRGFFKTRLVATGLTIMLAFVLFLAIVLIVIGDIFIDFVTHLNWINLEDYVVYMIFVVRFMVIFIVFFIAISSIYYFGPAVHYNWRFFSAGSLLATLLAIAVSYGFSYYVSNFADYNRFYGSIGVLIALMIWQLLLTVVLLIGYELNASFHHAYSISGVKRPILHQRKKIQ
ncbi:MAG: YihY/virulence factor BrkB family protein [Candidatus Cyclobacteriaceae bacterium M2_1C_046]